MPIKNQIILFSAMVAALATTACTKKDGTFSLLAIGDQYVQSSGANNKVDILWMVDGSGTMANHQNNLATNFGSFISGFVTKKFDYQMAVASTDAWVREHNYNMGTCTSNPNPTGNPNTIYKSSADCANTLATFGQLTHFRDGDIYGAVGGAPGVRSGIYLITSLMSPASVMSTFSTNVKTGIRGDGSRESAFQSLRAVLRRNANGSVGYGGETHTALASFRRDDAFLAVIIVSDEEDQGRKQDGSAYANTQAYVDGFVTFMDGYTGSVPGNRTYNVSSITIDDINNCSYGLHPQATQGDRYVAIANAANGVVGSICSADFSSKLDDIASKIVMLSTRFQLSQEPAPGTIFVSVSGVSIPQSASNGWTYEVENGFHYIVFHGAATPENGEAISITYDPLSLL